MREFSISLGGATIAGVADAAILFLNPPTAPNPNIEFLRYWVGQSANATSAQQRVSINTQVSAWPTTNVTVASVVKLKPSDPNASVITGTTSGAPGSAHVNGQTSSGGALTLAWADAFNVLNGWLMVPTPPETRVMPAGSTATSGSAVSLTFPVTAATLTNWSAGWVFREV